MTYPTELSTTQSDRKENDIPYRAQYYTVYSVRGATQVPPTRSNTRVLGTTIVRKMTYPTELSTTYTVYPVRNHTLLAPPSTAIVRKMTYPTELSTSSPVVLQLALVQLASNCKQENDILCTRLLVEYVSTRSLVEEYVIFLTMAWPLNVLSSVDYVIFLTLINVSGKRKRHGKCLQPNKLQCFVIHKPRGGGKGAANI